MNKLHFSLLLVGLVAGFIQNASSNVIGIGNGIGCASNAIANGLTPNGITSGNGIGSIGKLGLAATGINSVRLADGAAGSARATNPGPAIGTGDVAIGGELSVGGSTSLSGKVPVIGYVTFEGTVPAGGIVSVAPGCECAQIVS